MVTLWHVYQEESRAVVDHDIRLVGISVPSAKENSRLWPGLHLRTAIAPSRNEYQLAALWVLLCDTDGAAAKMKSLVPVLY